MGNIRKIRITLIEPSEIVTSGIRSVISDSSEFTLVQTVKNLQDFQPEKMKADITIVNPIVLRFSEQQHIKNIFPPEQCGAVAALVYSTYNETITRFYDSVLSIYDSSDKLKKKLEAVASDRDDAAKSEHDDLSQREKEILVAVAQGKTNKEIADEFNLSVYTVITHRKNISRKTGINSISGLTVYAIINRLVDVNSL